MLSDARHREHHVRSKPKDWDSFFALAGKDPVLSAGRARLLEAAAADTVVLVSGRPERLRVVTADWLREHGFPELPLYLRADLDHRPASTIKREILMSLGGPSIITLVVDDDPRVAAALVAAGYRVELVPGGEMS